MITLDALLALAREHLSLGPPDPASRVDTIARGIVDMLGESFPCGGYDAPRLGTTMFGKQLGMIVVVFDEYSIEAGDLRALCAAMLRKCDEADAANAEGDRT